MQLHQKVFKRKTKMVDEGTFGFHDYVSRYAETEDEYLKRVSEHCTELEDQGIKYKIQFLSEDSLVVFYKSKW